MRRWSEPADVLETGERRAHARIVRISRDLTRRLEGGPAAAGRVHSVFAHTVNVEWGDGGLLTLQGPGRLRAPFAAAAEDAALLRGLRPGGPVTAEPGRLRLPGLMLSWEGATRVDCAVPVAISGRDRAVIDAVEAHSGTHAPALGSARGLAACAALTTAIETRDAGRLVAAADGLLGLGEGLTPAGDDCLVGALAVLHATGHAALRSAGVTAEIARAARTRTTTIAREFVVHALAGRFSEPMLALLGARTPREARRAAARLAGLGGSSGADTLVGMRLAWPAAAA